jgi:ATPase subunit of ABC transporter with duplicated ATPase domains
VLSIVAALGVDPDALLASAHPSPGEARKLALASGLARQVWALVLDEPTNHLDLPSVERIEAALADYPGALVVVTHDQSFARCCTHTMWELREGRVRVSSRGSR